MNYLHLPEEFHKSHEKCFNLIKQIEEFIIDPRYSCLKGMSLKLEEKDIDLLKKARNPFDFLEQSGSTEDLEKMIKHSLIHALLIDFCYFMQEALECSAKMRLVVSYSLIRKPIIDNLKIFLRIFLDSSFLEQFINEESFDPTLITDNELKELLDATDQCRVIPIKGQDIYNLVFDKKNRNSILNISNRAIHPATNRNDANSTGKMNLNFMFVTPEDNYNLWHSFYATLIPILMFYTEILNIIVWEDNSLPQELLTERYGELTNILQCECDK